MINGIDTAKKAMHAKCINVQKILKGLAGWIIGKLVLKNRIIFRICSFIVVINDCD